MEAQITIPALQQMKRDGRKCVGVVAWDTPMAAIADRAGMDFVSVLIVGESERQGRRLACQVRACSNSAKDHDSKGNLTICQ